MLEAASPSSCINCRKRGKEWALAGHLALKFAKLYHFSLDSMDYLVVTQFYYATLNFPLSLMFLFLVLQALLCDLRCYVVTGETLNIWGRLQIAVVH